MQIRFCRNSLLDWSEPNEGVQIFSEKIIDDASVVGILQHPECNISTMYWNRITGRSSVGSARVSIFVPSGELGARSPAMKRFI
jgi:hypothetical protein